MPSMPILPSCKEEQATRLKRRRNGSFKKTKVALVMIGTTISRSKYDSKIVCFEVFSKPQTGSNASERLCEERMLDLKQVL